MEALLQERDAKVTAVEDELLRTQARGNEMTIDTMLRASSQLRASTRPRASSACVASQETASSSGEQAAANTSRMSSPALRLAAPAQRRGSELKPVLTDASVRRCSRRLSGANGASSARRCPSVQLPHSTKLPRPLMSTADADADARPPRVLTLPVPGSSTLAFGQCGRRMPESSPIDSSLSAHPEGSPSMCGPDQRHCDALLESPRSTSRRCPSESHTILGTAPQHRRVSIVRC